MIMIMMMMISTTMQYPVSCLSICLAPNKTLQSSNGKRMKKKERKKERKKIKKDKKRN